MMHSPKDQKPRHPRVNITSWARLTISDEEEALPANVVDISRAGLGLYAKRTLDVATGLDIELKFFDAENNVRIEKIRGRVVRCERLGSVFFIGIRFSEPVGASKNPHLTAAIADLEGA